MLTELLLFIILIIGAVFFANLFKRKYEETLILWIFSIVFIMYVAGLTEIKLRGGYYIIIILTIIMLIFNIIPFIKNNNKKEDLKKFFSPAMVIFYTLFIILCVVHHGRLLYGWDEFSHWGDCVKAMYSINDFVTSPLSISAFKNYPPSMALFQFFAEVVNGSFNESLLFITYQLVGVALFLPLFNDLKWRDKYKIFIALVLVTTIPVIFNPDYYTTIYIDSILGLTYGLLSIYILKADKFDIFEALRLGLGAVFLVNLKEVGIFLAILICLLLIAKLLPLKRPIKKDLKRFIPLIIVIVMIIFAKKSWNYELSINNLNSNSIAMNVKDILKILTGVDRSYRHTVMVNYVKALASNSILGEFINLSMVKIMILLSFLFGFIIKKEKKNRYQFIIMLSGLYLYIFGLLILYCFNFSEYEAVILASFNRYLSIYLVGILVYIAYYVYSKSNKCYMTILAIFLLLNVPFLNQLDIFSKSYNKIREPYTEAADYIKTYAKDNDKIYIVSQNTTGYDYWVMKFSLRPLVVAQGFTWSLGEPYYEGDIWTSNMTSDELMNLLVNENYDYLYCYKCDKQFKDTYGDIFMNKNNIVSGELYKLDKEKKILKSVNE